MYFKQGKAIIYTGNVAKINQFTVFWRRDPFWGDPFRGDPLAATPFGATRFRVTPSGATPFGSKELRVMTNQNAPFARPMKMLRSTAKKNSAS